MDQEEHDRMHREADDEATIAFWKLVAVVVLFGGSLTGLFYLADFIYELM